MKKNYFIKVSFTLRKNGIETIKNIAANTNTKDSGIKPVINIYVATTPPTNDPIICEIVRIMFNNPRNFPRSSSGNKSCDQAFIGVSSPSNPISTNGKIISARTKFVFEFIFTNGIKTIVIEIIIIESGMNFLRPCLSASLPNTTAIINSKAKEINTTRSNSGVLIPKANIHINKNGIIVDIPVLYTVRASTILKNSLFSFSFLALKISFISIKNFFFGGNSSTGFSLIKKKPSKT